jgi:hypothetical protein
MFTREMGELAWLPMLILDSLAFSSMEQRPSKCKQLFECQHLLLLRGTGGQSSNLHLNVVHVLNTIVN